MLRTTLAICLLFSSCAISFGADATETKALPAPAMEQETLPEGWFGKAMPSVLKKGESPSTGVTTADASEPIKRTLNGTRFDANLSPTVHVNSTGLENTHGSRRAPGAVDRLKRIRETPILQKESARRTTTAKKVLRKSDATTGKIGSSRRAKKVAPAEETTAPPTAAAPKVNAKSLQPVPEQADLPSVVTRRGLAEPTLALPKAAAPAKLPTPTAPITAGPSLASPKEIVTSPAPAATSLPTQPQAFDFTPSFGNGNQAVISPGGPRVAALPSLPPAKPVKAETMRDDSFSQMTLGLPDAQPKTVEQPAKPTAKRTNVVRQQQTQPKPRKAQDNQLLSNRSPVLNVKTHGPQRIRVGRAATYYVTAANTGDLAAEDVLVDVNVPNWAELTKNQSTDGAVRIEPNLNGDNVLHWSIRDLKPGSEQRLKLDLVPRASKPIELGVTWNFKSMSAMAQIEVEEAKLQLTVTGASDIRFGDTKLYTITVSNPGNGDAENVVLTLLPVSNNGGTAGEQDLGTIKAGTQRTIEVELTTRQAGELAVKAFAIADGGLRADGEQPVRVRRPNLVVEAQGPAKKYAGTTARYAIKVTNNGDATARDVTTTAALPAGARFVSSSQSGAFDKNRNLVQWTLGAIRPGAFKVVEVTTVVNGAGSNRLDARANAKLDQLSAAASAVTLVEALADLRLTVIDPVGPVALGTEVAYEIKIENRGTKVANNINVVGYFSEGIEPNSIEGWQGEVEVGQVVLQTIPRISAGQSVNVKVMAQATRPGNHVFRAELDSADPNTKTKLAVEEWTVFHDEGQDLQMGIEDTQMQQADRNDELPLEPVRR